MNEPRNETQKISGCEKLFRAEYEGKTVGGKVQDANFFLKTANYSLGNGKAFIALKNSSGLSETMIKDPAFTTSYGFGQQICQAIKLGAREIILELDGGSTNDGGAGAAAALGAEFFNAEGETFVPTGGTLEKIERVDAEKLKERIKGVAFVALCYENLPLLGENGCSLVASEKKGAKKEKYRKELEWNMRVFVEKTKFLNANPEADFAGCEGGLGYFVQAFLNGKAIDATNYRR